MKASELDGVQLDYWVARAEGWEFFWSKHNYWSVTPTGSDHSTAACAGWTPFDCDTGKPNARPEPWEAMFEFGFAPSTDWSQGGPIIERERIELLHYGTMGAHGSPWEAQMGQDIYYIDQGPCDVIGGPSPLVAAMRCYVASKFGEELPEIN